MICQGTVTAINDNKAKVKVSVVSECMGCQSRNHCHSGTSGGKNITVINDYGAKISDTVVFESDTGKVILSAALIWILPLISMVVGYLIGERIAGGIWAIIAAFAFLVVSFAFLKVLDNVISGGRTFYPRITKIINTDNSAR